MTYNAGWYNNFLILALDVTGQSAPDKGNDDTTYDAEFSAVTKLEKLDCVTNTLFVKESVSILLVVFDVSVSNKQKIL